jgi:aspartate ammonia-lyase
MKMTTKDLKTSAVAPGIEGRIETDALGDRVIPATALYGANTIRGEENFPFKGARFGDVATFVRAFAAIKKAAALTNVDLGTIDRNRGKAIAAAADEMHRGELSEHLVISLMEGSGGTSTNMNVNEVLANRALQLLGHSPGDYQHLHPNDHVNLGQSTNDVFPTALELACIEFCQPALDALTQVADALEMKSQEFDDVYRLGRTCLQDAQPMTLGQAFGGYSALVRRAGQRLAETRQKLLTLPLGGTAIGTGLGAAPGFRERVIERLAAITGFDVTPAENIFDAMQNLDETQRLSSDLNTAASGLARIARDFIILSSGPNGGLAEIALPAVQPGSSIMPGKVNPVIPMAVVQVSLAIAGNHVTISQAVQEGLLEINHYENIICTRMFDSFRLVTTGATIFAERCISGIEANRERCEANLMNSFALATILVPDLGYAAVSKLVKESISAKRPFLELAEERGLISKGDAMKAIKTAARGN